MKRVNHVLMTADTVGGVWNYALELSRVLGQHDVHVSLATMGARVSPQQRAEANAISNLRLYESSFKLEWMPEPWDDVRRAGDWLLQLEAILSPDVVHLNGYCHGNLPWHSPVLVAAHSCVLSWWQAVKGERAPIDWLCYEDEVREGLFAANAVVAPTHAMMNCLTEHYGHISNPHVIYNARDPKVFQPKTKEEFVLTVGRIWDEGKNVASVDRAAQRIPWPVYVAGETDSPAGEGSQQRNVQGLGKLSTEEVADYYSRASIYALPARYEPFGLSALEAALSGCALVLGDIDSLREVWEDSAMFVDPEDANALAKAVNLLIDDENERKRMAEKAMSRAQQFNPDVMGEKYMEVYESLVHQQTTMGKSGKPHISLR